MVEAGAIVAGICFERYRAAGLVTYMLVAPSHRRQGIGQALQRAAVAELGGTVFGEVVPSKLSRNLAWGAKIVDIRYVQPSLGPGLARDRGLHLLALEARGDSLPGELVRGFIEELYLATEGGPPDNEIRIGVRVPLILAPPSLPG